MQTFLHLIYCSPKDGRRPHLDAAKSSSRGGQHGPTPEKEKGDRGFCSTRIIIRVTHQPSLKCSTFSSVLPFATVEAAICLPPSIVFPVLLQQTLR